MNTQDLYIKELLYFNVFRLKSSLNTQNKISKNNVSIFGIIKFQYEN